MSFLPRPQDGKSTFAESVCQWAGGLKVRGEWRCVLPHLLSRTQRNKTKQFALRPEKIQLKLKRKQSACTRCLAPGQGAHTHVHNHTRFWFFHIQECRLVKCPLNIFLIRNSGLARNVAEKSKWMGYSNIFMNKYWLFSIFIYIYIFFNLY